MNLHSYASRRLAFLLLLAFFCGISLAHSQQPPAPLVIEGGTLIDGNGGTPVRDALVIIEGNKISPTSSSTTNTDRAPASGSPFRNAGTVSLEAGRFVVWTNQIICRPYGQMDVHSNRCEWEVVGVSLYVRRSVYCCFMLSNLAYWPLAATALSSLSRRASCSMPVTIRVPRLTIRCGLLRSHGQRT